MSDEAKNVCEHDGGDYQVYTQSGVLVEQFPSVECAIENLVAAWHESEIPEAFTIRTKSQAFLKDANLTVATICPIGSDSFMVVRSNGDTMTWSHIHYVTVDGKYSYTSAYLNNVEYQFKF